MYCYLMRTGFLSRPRTGGMAVDSFCIMDIVQNRSKLSSGGKEPAGSNDTLEICCFWTFYLFLVSSNPCSTLRATSSVFAFVAPS